MKVILLADVKKVGRKGEVKEVANGYAQSVLLPRKLALPGTPENLKKVEKQVALKEDKKAFNHALLVKTLKDLFGKTIIIAAKANENGTLFEAIHEKQILEAIRKECGVEIPDSVLKLQGPIKKNGEHILQLEGEGERVTVTLSVS